MLPKVKFELIALKQEISVLSYDCISFKTGWDWSVYVFRAHPQLNENMEKARTRKEKTKVIRNYTKEFWRSELQKLKTRKILFQNEWDKVNDRYVKTLSEILETDWPKNRKEIFAMISINPIGARILNRWTFQIFYMEKPFQMREAVAHEILHFLYFKKWKEVFPDADEKTFGMPYLEWQLSEILAPVILRDKRIQNILKSETRIYPEHEKAKIGKRSLIQHFEVLYKESRKKKEPFAQFLQTAYKEAQKHRDKILNA